MRTMILLLAMALSCGGAQAAMPQTLNYQGRLTSSSGTPVDGAVVMTFKLYDAAIAGNLKWSEIQPSVTVTNGIFDVVLGSITPLPPLQFDAPYYLTVTINAEAEMSPRQPVTASAYAIRSANADALAPAATVAGSQVTGAISSATLPAGNVTGTIATAQLANGAVTAVKLANNGCTTGQVLKYNGSLWACASDNDTNSGGTVTSVTAGAGLTGGTITTAGTIGLGTVPVANGGTGATALATNGVLYGQGTGAVGITAAGAAGQVLAGSAGAPAWTGSPTLSGNLTLAQNSTASAGNVMKGAFRFLHNFGSANVFLGGNAGNFTMTGGSNTIVGADAFTMNTTGTNNTAIGRNTLGFNTVGGANTASGANALLNNTTGNDNTANGYQALMANVGGGSNTAIGFQALTANVSGERNIAIGSAALSTNSSGLQNTAIGAPSLFANSTGSDNVGIGYFSLENNTTGSFNTAIGAYALSNNAIGELNTAVGFNAGKDAQGSGNLFLGNEGLPSDQDTIRIGSGGPAGSHKHFFVWPVSTVQLPSGVPVIISGGGELGVASSSRRYKDDIADMDEASTALMKLRPVTFHYKSERDRAGRTLQYGLIAEEVAVVYPGLVVHAADGQIDSVMYQFLPPMLLNEYQKQQREYQKQQRTIAMQAMRIDALEKQAAEIATLKQQIAELQVFLRAAGRTAAPRLSMVR